jgi:hypothetical protein
VVFKSVVTTVWREGKSGNVDVGSSYQYSYEPPDGRLAAERTPPVTLEKFESLIDHPTQLSSGQKTTGQIAFESTCLGHH